MPARRPEARVAGRGPLFCSVRPIAAKRPWSRVSGGVGCGRSRRRLSARNGLRPSRSRSGRQPHLHAACEGGCPRPCASRASFRPSGRCGGIREKAAARWRMPGTFAATACRPGRCPPDRRVEGSAVRPRDRRSARNRLDLDHRGDRPLEAPPTRRAGRVRTGPDGAFDPRSSASARRQPARWKCAMTSEPITITLLIITPLRPQVRR